MWIREKSNFITLEYVLSLLRCKKLVMVLPSFRIHNRDSVFFIVVFSCSRSPLFSSLSCCFIVNAASSRLFHWPREKSRDGPRCHCDRPIPAWVFFSLTVQFQYCSIFGGNFYFYCTHFFFFFFGNHKNVQIQKCVISVYFLVSSSCNIWCFSCNFIKVVNKTWRRYQQYYWEKNRLEESYLKISY